MALLSPQDEATLKDHLSVIGNPVQLVLFTQTVGGSETGLIAKQILSEVAALNPKISVVEKSFSTPFAPISPRSHFERFDCAPPRSVGQHNLPKMRVLNDSVVFTPR